MTRYVRIEIQIPRDAVGGFTSLLGQGIHIEVPLGVSIEALLNRHLGLRADYVRDRIQTIFLNGKAIDREQEAIVTDGAVIALSAAMPGLVGATLRKSGLLSGMRSDISQNREERLKGPERGRITLKMFNMIADEIGPALLSQGVWITGRQMVDTLAGFSSLNATAGMSCRCNDIPADYTGIRKKIEPDDDVFLRVDFT